MNRNYDCCDEKATQQNVVALVTTIRSSLNTICNNVRVWQIYSAFYFQYVHDFIVSDC